MSTDTKAQAIAAINEQMRLHHISLAELKQAQEMDNKSPESSPKGDIAIRMFTMLGGIFIFAGVAAYTTMFWHEMNSAMHVIITLGVGIVLQALGLLAVSGSYKRAAAPLLLIALFLQPTGWFVAIDEWFPHGNDARYAVLFVMAVMAIQQGAIFSRYRLTLLLTAALGFAYAAAFTLLSLLDANQNLTFAGMGISMVAIAQVIRKTPHAALSGLVNFIGGSLFCGGTFEMLRHTPIELFYLGLTCGLMYLSTLMRSSALLTVSTLAMLGYIGYFTEEHFVHSMGWPLSLVALGIAFFAIGGSAFRIKKQYMAR